MPEKNPKVKLRLKNSAMLPSYFDYIFFAPKTTSTSQAQIKPEIFVNFRPEPDPKIPARLTTLLQPPLSQVTEKNLSQNTRVLNVFWTSPGRKGGRD